ncbi:hypothetical protein GTQ43_08570 [Nostoc sp. KVJ3]|uniref:hypothetical protein n=1 Tax=Nostoc sp. KVJ3 TaxID=457945 RepID=UPI002238C25C|nr:hypothetical protein [Nostoc sp. KVJ3]MCW5313858.1 hypothetical protein [Nostoc sp. KVJ3]
MLSSKQLLWHVLEAALSAGFPIGIRPSRRFPGVGYCRVAVGLKRFLPPSIR